jgi:hypothetical protein
MILTWSLLIACLITLLPVNDAFTPANVSELMKGRIFRPSLMNTTNPIKVDSIEIVIVAGVFDNNAILESVPLVNSLILLSSAPIRIHYLTNRKGLEAARAIHTSIDSSRIPVGFSVRLLDEQWVHEQCQKIKFDETDHHSGVWGAAKLFLHDLYPEFDRIMVLDTDMIFVKDPAILWKQFYRDYDIGIWQDGVAPPLQVDPPLQEIEWPHWIYRMPLNEKHAWHICSCVILINIRLAREKTVITDDMLNALKSSGANKDSKVLWLGKGLYHSDVGDQGVFFALFKAKPFMFKTLSQTWNMDYCHHYYSKFTKRVPLLPLDPNRKKSLKFGILHRNCVGKDIFQENLVKSWVLPDMSKVYFDYYDNYPLGWHDGDYAPTYEELDKKLQHNYYYYDEIYKEKSTLTLNDWKAKQPSDEFFIPRRNFKIEPGWKDVLNQPFTYSSSVNDLDLCANYSHIIIGSSDSEMDKTGETIFLGAGIELKKLKSLNSCTTASNFNRGNDAAFWYYCRGVSIGFLPRQNDVYLKACDNRHHDKDGPNHQSSGILRLCWHMNGSGGWRVGDTLSLINGPQATRFRKRILCTNHKEVLPPSLSPKPGIIEHTDIPKAPFLSGDTFRVN